MTTLWQTMLQQIELEYERDKFNFLRQRMISRTMHPNCDKLAQLYYKEILASNEFQDHITKLPIEQFGNPLRFSQNPNYSPLTIQHLYHLKHMFDNWGIFAPDSKIDYVAEIGGGYGNMCRIFHQLGFAGEYVIADFPLINKIQKDYLQYHGIHPILEDNIRNEKVIPETKNTSLLHATFSINEMPMNDRKYMESIYECFDYIFIAHNTAFDGIDNMEYFDQVIEQLKEHGFEVQHYKDPHKGQSSYFLLARNPNELRQFT